MQVHCTDFYYSYGSYQFISGYLVFVFRIFRNNVEEEEEEEEDAGQSQANHSLNYM